MKPDRFDLIVISAALLIAAAAAVMASGGPAGDGRMPRAEAARIMAEPPDPAVYQEVSQAGALMEAGQPEAAVDALKKLSIAHPAMSEPHALMGQAYSRMLDYPAAMREFRIALMGDPDYVDKKSKKFIGKRIKATVRDGMAGAKKALSANPDDTSARSALRDAYYLERMLAGGCE